MNMIVDTSSTRCWVVSSQYKQDEAFSKGVHSVYDPAASTSAEKQVGQTWCAPFTQSSSSGWGSANACGLTGARSSVVRSRRAVAKDSGNLELTEVSFAQRVQKPVEKSTSTRSPSEV